MINKINFINKFYNYKIRNQTIISAIIFNIRFINRIIRT
jgi:hypothetical protein